MNDSYQLGGRVFSKKHGQFFEDVQRSTKTVTLSEAVNIANAGYFKDAAGVCVLIDLAYDKIRSAKGAQVGSFWGDESNRVLAPTQGQGFVETDGSAAVALLATSDLEELLESVTFGRYVLKVTDSAGNVLYGWIGGVAESGTTYTFSIYNGTNITTQNWFQGGATSFNGAGGVTVEVFEYTSSLSYGASATLSEEVPWPDNLENEGKSIHNFMSSLDAGQYAVDYVGGRVAVKKADAADTVTFTYKIKAGAMIVPSDSETDLAGVYAGNTVAAVADKGMLEMTLRQDTPIADSAADGVYQPAKSDNIGARYVHEVNRPDAEDNTNDVIATAGRPLADSTYTTDQYQNNSFQTANIKASAGNLYGFSVINTTGSIRYIQFHKTATTPAGGGAVTANLKFLVPANSSLIVGTEFFGTSGIHSTLGWAVANSSTLTTYTAGTAGDLVVDLNYK